MSFAKVCVHKLPDLEALHCAACVCAGFEKVTGVSIGQELADETRLCQDKVAIDKGWYHSAWVDGEVIRYARNGDVDEVGFKLQLKFTKRNLNPVSKWAMVSCVESDGRGH